MKVALLLGFIGGLAGVLAGAHVVPWMEHERLPSKTTVQSNGGRVEQFVIRLPADRLGGAGRRWSGAAVALELPAPLSERPLLLEQFKVRDADGNVIGVAARHETDTAEGAASAWWIVIPSRGAMLLAGNGPGAGTLAAALAADGWREGLAWSGDLEVPGTNAETSTMILGTQEFAGLEGGHSERWRITGVSEAGQLRGTVELATITFSTT